jgi:hypothetical protein
MTGLRGNSRFTLGGALRNIPAAPLPKKPTLENASLPREELRRELVALGIARERHRFADLVAMLPARLHTRPYDDFNADSVAEVLVYLVGKGVLEVPSAELAGLRVEWGERLCHFYRSESRLLALLTPYFQDGLAQGERCLWIAAPGTSDGARQKITSLADSHGSPDQLEMLEDAQISWHREEQRALAQGYRGLRVCGEALVIESQGLARMKALSTYRSDGLEPAQMAGVLRDHDGALVMARGCWQRVKEMCDFDGYDAQLA